MISTRDWIEGHALATPNAVAQIDVQSGRQFTYAELEDRVRRATHWLLSQGIGEHHRIALLGRNSTDVFELFVACHRIDAIFVPMNWRLAGPELVSIAQDAEPTLLIHDREFSEAAEAISQALPSVKLASIANGAPSDYETGVAAAAATPVAREASEDDLVLLLYTSGTTGGPKGVEITVGMVNHSAVGAIDAWGISSSSRGMTFVPMFHAAGIFLYAAALLSVGGSNVILRQSDPSEILNLLSDKSLGITHIFGVPTNFQLMLQTPTFASSDLSNLKSASIAGAAVPETLLRSYAEYGLTLTQGWGMTETAASGLMLPAKDAIAKCGAAGLPMLGADVRIWNRDNQELPPGEVGQIVIKGPQVMRQYWRKAAETAAAFHSGYLLTGDAGYRDDDGYIYLVDRWKDMYISGGENVYPAEVENVLLEHDAIALAAVIGVPHERWGEAGCAFVVLKSGYSIAEDAIRTHCEGRLARFKWPSIVRIIDAMPLTASGKVAKPVLREEFTSKPTA